MALAKRDIWFAESRFGLTASLDSDWVEFPFYPQIQSQICKLNDFYGIQIHHEPTFSKMNMPKNDLQPAMELA